MKGRSEELGRQKARSVVYGFGQTVFLVADDSAALERMRRGALAAGCRISGISGVAEAEDGLDGKVAVGAVAVHLHPECVAGPLLVHLISAAREGRYRSLVSSSPESIDRLANCISHPDVRLLCEPDGQDWAEALSAAVAPRRLWLNDIGKGRGTPPLERVRQEAARIATALASFPQDEASAADGRDSRSASRRIEAGQIRAIIRARRMRDHYFQSDLFADPAWDMLLDLMAARLERQKVAVSSLCIAAAVPPTTALRWIKTLCELGLFVRVADAEDGRRVFIELSDEAAANLEAYLTAAHRVSPILG